VVRRGTGGNYKFNSTGQKMNLVNGCRLQYFHKDEFVARAAAGGHMIDWSNDMDRRLLVLLDGARSMWGNAIRISNADGSIGRLAGSSRHSLAQWGSVMAVDVVPAGIKSRADAERFYYMAKQIGFGGIGCYPEWNQGVGFHLDSRGCEPYKPACWGVVGGSYVSLHETFNSMR
jgi:hypothetical protein